MTRKSTLKFIYTILTLCVLNGIVTAQEIKRPILKFGIIADIQYCDCETSGSRFYRNSLNKLDKCVEELNRQSVDFSINLGDLVDRDTESNLDSVLVRLKKLNATVYNTTGNHDYGGIKNNQNLYNKLDMPAAYYSFDKSGWMFIMLNTNEIASYANIEGTELAEELTQMKETIESEGRSNGANYNGGISKNQMQWLKGELDKSIKEGKSVIIFTHHPLSGIKGLTALNDKEIIELISKYPSVKCVISGHHHTGAFDIQHNIPLITSEGMIETENQNAFGIVEIYSDKIILKGYDRSKSYTISL